MKVLFITNGHGEDVIACRIIKEISSNNIDINVFPLVGDGKIFESLNVKILGTRRKMPSGGFIYQSASNIIRDIFAGLIKNTIEQIKLSISLRDKFDKVIAIGDIVPIISAVLMKKKFYFIGCAKSDYYDYSYTPWEKYLLRKYCIMCFPRDEKTTENLIKAKIKCAYVGNPMMDCFEITGKDYDIKKEFDYKIGILPGTRDDFLLNLEDILIVTDELDKIAVANNKKILYIVATTKKLGREIVKPNIIIAKNEFGDVLNNSKIIIGLSGTGNEQAAGLGKPIVSFPGRGVQYTKAFAERQKQLLGEALYVSDRNFKKTAEYIWKLLNNPKLMENMALAGIKRMGRPGASKIIASIIQNENWL